MNPNPTLLVVDDEESIRRLLQSRFEREGCTVLTAENAAQAWQLLQSNKDISLVVTDIKMPGKTGLELMADIKGAFSSTKVIVITGHGENSTGVDALQNGAYAYLEKPFNLEELVVSASRALKEVSSEASNVIPLRRPSTTVTHANGEEVMNYTQLKKKWTDQFEQDYIAKILEKHQGNVTNAAREAGLDRSNFLRLLRRHQMHASQFRKIAA